MAGVDGMLVSLKAAGPVVTAESRWLVWLVLGLCLLGLAGLVLLRAGILNVPPRRKRRRFW